MEILLAGFNTRAFAESAVRAGFNVISVDCFGDLDHRIKCQVHSVPGNAIGTRNMEAVVKKVLSILGEHKVKFFCYTSGFENHPEYLTAIQDTGVQLLGNSPETISKVRDILRLSKLLSDEGFNVPLSVNAQKNKLCQGLKSKSQGKWVEKPIAGGGGRGIKFAFDPCCIPEGYFLQEFIAGRSCSFAFVSTGKKCRVLGVSEQLIGTQPYNNRQFGYAGNIFPLSLPYYNAEKMLNYLEQMAEWLSINFGLVGLNGVDFIFDGEKCWFIEINPRYTASMELIEMASGLSMAKLHFDACMGIMPEEKGLFEPLGRNIKSRSYFYGKKVVYADRDIQVIYPRHADKAWITELYNLGIRDIPCHKEKIRKGSPVATVVSRGKNYNECVQRLHELTLLVEGFNETLHV